MRKSILMFLALVALFVGTAQADSVDDYYSTADNIVVVKATSAGRGALTASADGTYLHSASYTGLTMSTTDEASYLVFYPADDDYYYLYSVDAERLLNSTSGALTDGDGDTTDPLLFTIGALTGGYGYEGYAILESSGLRYNLGGSYQTTIDSWGTSSGWSDEDDAGNSFTFTIIEDVETSDIPSTIETILENIQAAQDAVESYEDVTSLDQLGSSVTVIMQSSRGVVASELGSTLLTSESSIDTSDETQKFVFYTTDDIDGYYLYSVNNAAFVTVYQIDGIDLSLEPTTFSILSSSEQGSSLSDTYPWIVQATVDGTTYWMNNNNNGNVHVDDWTYVDDGNPHRFVIVDEETDYSEEIAALLTETKAGAVLYAPGLLTDSMMVYIQGVRSDAYLTYDSDNGYICGNATQATADSSQLFVLYTTDDIDGYFLYSVGAGQFVSDSATNYLSETPDTMDLEQSSVYDGYPWRLVFNGGSYYLNLASTYTNSIVIDGWGGYDLSWYGYNCYYYDNDDGNNYRFIIATARASEVEEDIEALLASTDKWLQAHPAILTLDELDDSIEAGYKFYIKGALPGFVYAGESGLNASGSTASPSEEFDTSYEFGIIKHDEGEYFIYSVGQKAMLESDLVPNSRCVGLFTIGSPTSFTSLYWGDDSGDTSSYPFWICDSVGGNNINYNANQGVVMTEWGYSDTGNCYVFHVGNATEKLPEVYDVKISALGWRTLALPVATVIQSAVTAYSATSVSTSIVRFDEITDEVLGAEEGVVLYASGGGTFYFPESSETGSTGSIMTGVVGEGGYTFTSAGEAYVLRAAGADDDDNDLGVVFSLVEANETIDQYKAYVTAPASGESISFIFGSENIEGITGVEAATEPTGIYYDLQGRVVKNPQKGGIYIRDGKKVII